MSWTCNGGPAFPVPNDANVNDQEGMTLRDYFAAKELAKKDAASVCDRPEAYTRLADHCYRMADAMLAERYRDGGQA